MTWISVEPSPLRLEAARAYIKKKYKCVNERAMFLAAMRLLKYFFVADVA